MPSSDAAARARGGGITPRTHLPALALGFIMAVAVTAQSPEGAEQIAARLQRGEEDLTATIVLVTHLLSEKCYEAAGWWLDVAEKASDPPIEAQTARQLRNLRRSWASKRRAKDPFPDLSKRLLKLSENCLREKNYRYGRRLARMARDALSLAPDARLQKKLDGLWARLDNRKPDENQASLRRQKEAGKSLESRFSRALDDRMREARTQFLRWGTRSALPQIEALSSFIAKLQGEEQHVERMREFRLVLATLGAPLEWTLNLWIIADSGEARIYRNGVAVASTPGFLGVWSLRDGVATVDAARWKPVSMKVKAGDRIAIVVYGTLQPARPEDFLGTRVIALASILNANILQATAWHTAATHDIDALDTARRQPVVIGEQLPALESDRRDIDGHGRRIPTEIVSFTESSDEFSSTLVRIPVQPEVVDWFAKAKVTPAWISGGGAAATFVLDLPRLPDSR